MEYEGRRTFPVAEVEAAKAHSTNVRLPRRGAFQLRSRDKFGAASDDSSNTPQRDLPALSCLRDSYPPAASRGASVGGKILFAIAYHTLRILKRKWIVVELTFYVDSVWGIIIQKSTFVEDGVLIKYLLIH